MTKSKLIPLAVILISGLVFTACSKKEKVEALFTPTPPVNDQQVTGIDGQWKSECLPTIIGNQTRDVKFDGKNIEIVTNFYKDETCEEVNEDDKEVVKGTYSVQKTLPDGTQAIQVKIPLDNNVSALRDFNMKQTGETLEMSHYYNSAFDNAADQKLVFTLKKNTETAEAAVATAAESAAAADINGLQSGSYAPVSGYVDFCDQNISIAEINGRVFQIYIDFSGSCYGQALLDCDGAICNNDSEQITVLSSTSYEYINIDGEKAIFEKK